MIELAKVRPDDKELLWNIHQKYLYEMTRYYDEEMDEHGNYGYGYFDAYFSDPQRRALLLYDDKTLVGFAMIHPYSYIGEQPDYVLAEFTVFPMYRRKRLASQAAQAIFSRYKGRWELKYNEKNLAAKSLWTKVTARYAPDMIRLSNTETVLSFSVK